MRGPFLACSSAAPHSSGEPSTRARQFGSFFLGAPLSLGALEARVGCGGGASGVIIRAACLQFRVILKAFNSGSHFFHQRLALFAKRQAHSRFVDGFEGLGEPAVRREESLYAPPSPRSQVLK